MGVLDKPLTPCIGNCTTTFGGLYCKSCGRTLAEINDWHKYSETFGGLYCKSCGRTLAEINDWHKYSEEMKLKIMKRLEDEGYGKKKPNY
jgi:predicted Fe-S protein YdhL (DUF1289 family)